MCVCRLFFFACGLGGLITFKLAGKIPGCPARSAPGSLRDDWLVVGRTVAPAGEERMCLLPGDTRGTSSPGQRTPARSLARSQHCHPSLDHQDWREESSPFLKSGRYEGEHETFHNQFSFSRCQHFYLLLPIQMEHPLALLKFQ